MTTSSVRSAALAAAIAVIAATSAGATTTTPSAFALADPSLALAVTTVTPELALAQPTLPGVEFAGVHYRPRRSGYGRRPMDSQSVSQIHLGFFDPQGDPGRQFLVGVRGGPMVDPNVQLGVSVDWSHMSDNISSVSHSSTGPGGLPITTTTDLSRSTANLFPIMAFIQVGGTDDMSIIPYVGLGGGYEVMNLTADDYQSGASFDATYGGWGWQLWGGAAIPLSGRARLTAEAFLNTAELGRDVTDSLTGSSARETVKADGAGLRAGIAWGF
jgi:hypothetical protein